MEQELLSRLKVRPCCVLFRPIPILKCGFAQQRRFVHRNGSFILEDRYPARRGAGRRTDSDSLTLRWTSTTASIVRIIICSLLLIVSQRFAEGLLREVRRIPPAKHDMTRVESNVLRLAGHEVAG